MNTYGFIEDLPILSPEGVYETLLPLNSPKWDTDSRQSDTNTTSGSLGSPPQTVADFDNVFIPGLVPVYGHNGFQPPTTHTYLFPDTPETSLDHLLNEYQNDKLHIIAQPKSSYRGRYPSEIDELKKRAKRFVRAENNDKRYEYPTVKIPGQWCHQRRQLYIRVTLVTVKNDNVPYHCIHPYTIDTSDNNVIKDPINNSLYFRINENEFITHEKSFRIIIVKKKQDELKKIGPMRLFDSDEYDNQNMANSYDVKHKILLYHLSKSRLVFTIAEPQNNYLLPVPLLHTSVESQTMTDETDSRNSSTRSLNGTSNNSIKCIPQKGDWLGGDEIVIIMPTPIKKKEYKIIFDFGEYGQRHITETTQIDTKTILFRTPECLKRQPDKDLPVFIIIKDDNILIQRINFIYLAPSTIICAYCQQKMINFNRSNKRLCQYYDDVENDNGETLTSQMSQLTIKSTTNESHTCTPVSPSTNKKDNGEILASQMNQLTTNESCTRTPVSPSANEKETKFDKYLNQLKVALEIFIRTNDPSRLFRRTRVLLSSYDENPPLLNDAIERGHLQISLSLIEQVMDMNPSNGLLEKMNENGETPLLLSAKLNHWILIEPIIKNRPELVQQKDKNDNNLLHLLANVNDDQGAETIKNIFKTLPNDIKIQFIKGENKDYKTPLDIAQSHNNNQCIELLIDVEK